VLNDDIFVEKWRKNAHNGTIYSISFHASGLLFVASGDAVNDDINVRTTEGKFTNNDFA